MFGAPAPVQTVNSRADVAARHKVAHVERTRKSMLVLTAFRDTAYGFVTAIARRYGRVMGPVLKVAAVTDGIDETPETAGLMFPVRTQPHNVLVCLVRFRASVREDSLAEHLAHSGQHHLQSLLPLVETMMATADDHSHVIVGTGWDGVYTGFIVVGFLREADAWRHAGEHPALDPAPTPPSMMPLPVLPGVSLAGPPVPLPPLANQVLAPTLVPTVAQPKPKPVNTGPIRRSNTHLSFQEELALLRLQQAARRREQLDAAVFDERVPGLAQVLASLDDSPTLLHS